MSRYIRDSVQSMHAYVPGEQPADERGIKLNTNENPYPPSPNVAQALRELDVDSLRKYCDPLCIELRTAIAELHTCSVEQVFVGNGSDEILALCTRAFVDDDGAIGYLTPSYSLYPVLTDIRSVEAIEVPLANDFEWPDAEALADPRLRTCSLFFVTNPNAPTGILYPVDKVEALARTFPGVVVVDEAYVDFSAFNCLPLVVKCENVLIARTLSKSYSLAGLRCGYAIGSADLVGALHTIKDAYNVDAVTQALALAAVRDQDYFRDCAMRIIAGRARLADGLAERGFDVTPSESNFVWARPTKSTASDLFAELQCRQIYVRYFDSPRTRDHLRISVGTGEEIDALLKALDEILRGA